MCWPTLRFPFKQESNLHQIQSEEFDHYISTLKQWIVNFWTIHVSVVSANTYSFDMRSNLENNDLIRLFLIKLGQQEIVVFDDSNILTCLTIVCIRNKIQGKCSETSEIIKSIGFVGQKAWNDAVAVSTTSWQICSNKSSSYQVMKSFIFWKCPIYMSLHHQKFFIMWKDPVLIKYGAKSCCE
jgi:hypothetical protein